MEQRKPRSPVSFDESIKGRRSVYVNVLGDPFAKQRPRAVRKGRYITIYTPNETKRYEEKVKKEYKKFFNDTKLIGDLSVDIEGIFSIPKSSSKKLTSKMIDGEIAHTKKPDCDNMAKTPLDALNGIAYSDDAQINRLSISKRYGENPMLRVTIMENKML